MQRFAYPRPDPGLAFLRRGCAGAAALAGALCVPAHAGLVNWQAEVAQGTQATFSATNITQPTIVDIGNVGSNKEGDATYEFIVQGSWHGVAGSLLGSNTGGQNEAIRFQQFGNGGMVGATEYGAYDHSFGIPTVFGTPVVLTFTSFGEFGTTFLYVNGQLVRDYDAGVGFVNMALTLHGQVALGGTLVDAGGLLGVDNFNGTILGFAAYNDLPDVHEIRAHAQAFFADDPATEPEPNPVPEPASTALVGLGLAGLATLRMARRRTVR